MFDAHAHLQDIPQEKLPDFIERISASPVKRIFCNTTLPADWGTVASIASQLRICTPFFGVHPWFIEGLPDDWEHFLEHQMAKKKCGIGEIGLDKARGGVNFEKQTYVFVRQLDLACMARKTFSLHCVGAWPQLLAVLKKADLNGLPFILHGFNGSLETAKELVKLGGLLSIGPRNMDPGKLDALCSQISIEHFLVETDFSKTSVSSGVDVDLVEFYLKTLEACYQKLAKAFHMDLAGFSKAIQDNEQYLMGYV
mgnify:CR=1 FL=1